MSFLSELRRRNVLRVAAAYLVAAWLIVQVVETILPSFGPGDVAVRWTVLVLAILFVPVLVFAWAYEITPEGLRRETEVDRSVSITPQTGRRLDRMIMAALALALALSAIDRFVLDPERDAVREHEAVERARFEAVSDAFGDRSIAVLPFADLSPAKDQEYFSDGIAAELLNLLARIPELRVTARTSAFSFKGKDRKVIDIGRELNVAHVLEGSVRKAGDTVRITAQLIDARTDTHLWSQTYDRTLDDIFAVQDEIAAQVVAQLRVKLLGETPRAQATDPEAYSMFLRARHLRRQNTTDSTAQAQALLEHVLETDPGYLPALDDLATVYINQAQTGERPYDEGYELARGLTLRARGVDADFGRVYAQLGWIEAYYDGDLRAAAASFARAIELAPQDASLLGDASTFLWVIGRFDESLALGEAALTLDPLHPVSWINHAVQLITVGRYPQARSAARRALHLSAEIWQGEFVLGQALLYGGDPVAALETFDRESSAAQRLAGLAMARHALDDRAGADAAQQKLVAKHADAAPVLTALVCAFRGDVDGAFGWLDRAAAHNDPELVEIVGNPMRSELTDDPRWHAVLEKLGRTPEQLAAIDFDVDLSRFAATSREHQMYPGRADSTALR